MALVAAPIVKLPQHEVTQNEIKSVLEDLFPDHLTRETVAEMIQT